MLGSMKYWPMFRVQVARLEGRARCCEGSSVIEDDTLYMMGNRHTFGRWRYVF